MEEKRGEDVWFKRKRRGSGTGRTVSNIRYLAGEEVGSLSRIGWSF